MGSLPGPILDRAKWDFKPDYELVKRRKVGADAAELATWSTVFDVKVGCLPGPGSGKVKSRIY